MKVLQDEAQKDLLELLETLDGMHLNNPALAANIKYWAIELKPKRVRRKEVKTEGVWRKDYRWTDSN